LRFTIVQRVDEAQSSLLELTGPFVQRYADKWGYGYIEDKRLWVSDRHPVWMKYPAILRAFDWVSWGSWIVWVDSDILITNPGVSFESIMETVPDEADIAMTYHDVLSSYTISGDVGEFKVNNLGESVPGIWGRAHTGFMFLRKTEWLLGFLNKIYEDPRYQFLDMRGYTDRDEAPFTISLFNRPDIRHKFFLLPTDKVFISDTQRNISNKIRPWREGDFLVHVFMRDIEEKIRVIRGFIKRVYGNSYNSKL